MNAKRRGLTLLLLCVSGLGVFVRLPHLPQLQLTRRCACERCLSEDDPWLMQRFNRSVEPFLSADLNTSEDTFSWWRHLQAEGRNFSTYKTAVDNLFQFFPPRPHVTKPSPDRCITCAVVGNSGNLKRSHYGPLIDCHDVIIRMNTGYIKGFEADVGSRTTHRIMYPESAVDLDNSTHLVLFPFKIQDLEWLTKAFTTGFHGQSYMPVKTNIQANKDLVMVINPAFMRYVHDVWLEKKGRYPSTGFMALVLSLHICDEVHVFGFGADKDGNWSHYWETLKNKKLRSGVHPGNQEYTIIEELAEKGKFTFYKGW